MVEYAYNEGVALTARALKALDGMEVDQRGFSPDMLDELIEKHKERVRRSREEAAALRMLKAARGESDESLAQIALEFVETDEAKGDALTLPEQTALGRALWDERIELLKAGKPRLGFPWEPINEAIPFIYDDDMVLLTGESKTGKSSAMSQMCLFNSQHLRTALFHAEDNPLKMYLRRTAQMQAPKDPTRTGRGIHYSDLLKNAAPSEDLIRHMDDTAVYTMQQLGNFPVYVYCAGWTPEQIVQKIMELKRTHGIQAVFIDYLNKLEVGHLIRQRGSMAYALEYTVELFKREAGRKGAYSPVVLAQQDNPDGTTRDTKSSYIKSQVHIRFTREVINDVMQSHGHISVVVANDGRTGKFPARFYAPYMVWDTLSSKG